MPLDRKCPIVMVVALTCALGFVGCQTAKDSIRFQSKDGQPLIGLLSQPKATPTAQKSIPQQAIPQQYEVVTESIPLTMDESYPIDFPTALELAGADNWNVKIARQKVVEANAEYCVAKNAWLPSLNLSIGFNQHEGQIQATEGDVVTVSRNSLFLGGGAGIANAPLNGGSGGPPRMFVDFSLADAIFAPLSAKQKLGAQQARQSRVFNDTMLQSSLAYFELVRAQLRLAIAQKNLDEAQQLSQLTDAFVEGGKGTQSDTNRVNVIVNKRRQALAMAEADIKVRSAELATILQLDLTKLNPETALIALDADAVALDLVDMTSLQSMIAQAQQIRCEVSEASSMAQAAENEMMAEQWRPWLPNLYAGYSGGLFGGGQGSDLPNLDGRSDLDVVMTWQVKNLGFGSRAMQNSTRSRLQQRNFEVKQVRDQVAQQVTTTWRRVEQLRTVMPILKQSIAEAGSGLEKNLAAIKGLEGLPLEAIASLEQLAEARNDYTDTVIDYNQWQVRLVRASGNPMGDDPGCDGCGCVSPTECSSCIWKPKSCRKCR